MPLTRKTSYFHPRALGLCLAVGALSGCAPDPHVLAYVASSSSNHVQVLDLGTGAPVAKLYSGAAPWRLITSPDRKQLWVQHWYSETTAVVDLASHDIMKVLPYRGPGVFTGDGSQFVTYNWPLPDLHIVDSATREYVEKRPTEISRVYDIVPRNDGAGFWMTRFDPIAKGPKERHSYLMFFPYKNKEHIQTPPASYPTGLSPTRIVNSNTQPFSITVDSETNGVSVVNVLGDVTGLPTCLAPRAVLLSPKEDRMVIACWEGSGARKSEVVVYRTNFTQRPWPDIEQIGTAKLDGALVAGKFHPDGKSALLVDQVNHQLVELSVPEMKVKRTFPTGQNPVDVELITTTASQIKQLANSESKGRQVLKTAISKMQAARRPFKDMSWMETRSAPSQSIEVPEAKKTSNARDASVRLRNLMVQPAHVRTEAESNVVRLAANGNQMTVMPDGRYWTTGRQDLVPIVFALPSLSADEAIRQLAGDVSGGTSTEMRSGIAVDIAVEVTEGHHRYFLIGAQQQGTYVPQLWIDAETGLPTNLVNKFPVLPTRSGHDQTDFNGIVETKFYDFTKQEGKFVMPARMERVIDGKFTEKVTIQDVVLDAGLDAKQFDLAQLGHTARRPKFKPLKDLPAGPGARADDYIQHPFQDHEPYVGNPPVHGAHLPYFADWGVYDTPISHGLQLHNLKDGGVALQYNCADGCPAIVEQLKKIAAGFDKFVLVAPYPQMDAKIALTAWGKLETMDTVDAARIAKFVQENIGINHHAH